MYADYHGVQGANVAFSMNARVYHYSGKTDDESSTVLKNNLHAQPTQRQARCLARSTTASVQCGAQSPHTVISSGWQICGVHLHAERGRCQAAGACAGCGRSVVFWSMQTLAQLMANATPQRTISLPFPTS